MMTTTMFKENEEVKEKAKEESPKPAAPAKNRPFSHYPFLSLQRDMNHLFEDFARGIELWRPGFVEPFFGDFHAKVDLKDNENEIIVTAELAGVGQDDIEILLTADSLTIKGEKKEEKEENQKDKGYYRSERNYGFFQRILPLPCEIEQANVKASFKNGVLKIVMPKSTESVKKARKIEIE